MRNLVLLYGYEWMVLPCCSIHTFISRTSVLRLALRKFRFGSP